MMRLEEEIMESVKRNLPAAAAQHLGDYISECEEAKQSLKIAMAERDRIYKELETIRASIPGYLEKIKKADEILTRESAVQKRELEQKIIETKLQMTQEQLALAKWFFEIPFKNRTVRERVNGFDPIPIPGQTYPGIGSVSREKEITEE